MTVEVVPVHSVPEVQPGDDLAVALEPGLREAGVRDGDVVAVTQKVVSKAEGRIVPEQPDGHDAWVVRESARVVARRGDLVIAETRHGFVCANAGVDASNVAPGMLTLLPEDPDGSAARLRDAFRERLGVDVAVVVTDTFGRPWRNGLVNVAIGAAGLPSVVDLRGRADHTGRELEITIVALADEVAAASGLVMGKADRIPAAVVRGLTWDAPDLPARALVRPADEDLFRESPLLSLSSRRTIRAFGDGTVPRHVVEEAARAACTAPAPHHTRPWLFVALASPAAKRRLLGAMAEAWVADLRRDGTSQEVIDRRLSKSDAVLGAAPLLVVPLVRPERAHSYPDAERAAAEREMLLLSGGAAIQTFLLAIHAQGFGAAWISSTLFCKEETLAALDLEPGWIPLGAIAAGPLPDAPAGPRPPLDLADHLRVD